MRPSKNLTKQKKNIKNTSFKNVMSKLENLNKLNLNLPQKKTYFAKTSNLKRILAFFVDLLIFDFAISPLKKIMEPFLGSNISMIQSNYSFISGVVLVVGFLFFLYNYIFQLNFQQTPGMMLTGTFLISSKPIILSKIEDDSDVDNSDLDLTRSGSDKSNSYVEPEKIDAQKTTIQKKSKYVANILPTKLQLFIRNIIFVPLFPLVLFWILDPIYLLFRKERLIDKWFGIKTVEKLSM